MHLYLASIGHSFKFWLLYAPVNNEFTLLQRSFVLVYCKKKLTRVSSDYLQKEEEGVSNFQHYTGFVYYLFFSF